MSADLVAAARAWAEQDPDPDDRAEVARLLADGDPHARRELEDRFTGLLHFGTAGLRGAVGAGPNRMNRAVVRRVTVALARWLALYRPGVSGQGVVIGCDARHGSAEFADEATSVLTGAGIRVHRIEERQPTPLLAFAVRHLGAAGGVMITASHNPPQDNGYKLYLGDGAQIVPPVDSQIEALMERVGPLSAVPLGGLSGGLVTRHGKEVAAAYLDAIVAETPPAGRSPIPLGVVYTPMHGVAGHLFLDAMRRAGLREPTIVGAQADPDPDFPTVPFPNPEEPGALDLAFADARAARADLVLANDPDGDRLAVGVPDGGVAGGWRRLTGDELGVLLGSFLIDRLGEDRHARGGSGGADDAVLAGSTAASLAPLVAASIVSSTMLEKIATAAGVDFVATLTGFKWIVRAVDVVPGSRLVFGYEEALGYSVGDVVRDKDGIGAALAVLSLAAALSAQGRTLTDRLDDLARRHGMHATMQHTVETTDPATPMARLRATPPEEIAGVAVVRALDLSAGGVWQEGRPALPPADVLAYWLSSGARVIVRPSGTEPKLKAYLEVVRPVTGLDDGRPGDLGAARRDAWSELEALASALGELLGG